MHGNLYWANNVWVNGGAVRSLQQRQIAPSLTPALTCPLTCGLEEG
ncbi:MAG: hypothetical protein KME15_08055 [Drouetiella hepatica Uher 2000/2452]|uniref:Uncharacterized protein n=1 Tax=Drouetiella hepatica Uher 2000/2452 TaxID=904376 RepID=A0A951UNF9_9CYAN|nr:hypothetical protein [Drouetiella hepatica Uher 2000/2452]